MDSLISTASPSTSIIVLGYSPSTNGSEDADSDKPTSPRNISPDLGCSSINSLLVREVNSETNSMDSVTEATSSNSAESHSKPTQSSSRTNHFDLLDVKDALKPDPSTDHKFEVKNNKFAFSPGQLGKLHNPKSLGAFHALGGLDGIEQGLQTNRRAGLSMDEEILGNAISFEYATTARSTQMAPEASPAGRITHTDIARKAGSNAFADRTRVYSDNRLPVQKPKHIFQLA
jgi:Ca2+-transporting ATPase